MRLAGRIVVVGYVVTVLAGSTLLGLSSGRSRGAPPDEEEAKARRVFAARALAENCAFCHGLDLVESQRLTSKQWQTEIEKMVGWGAPITDDQRSLLVEFLAAEYPINARPIEPRKLTVAQALDQILPLPPAAGALKGKPDRGRDIYARNCANCHGAEGQGADLGPTVVERPVLVRPGEFTEMVRKGRGRMPGFVSLLDRQAEADLLSWLVERRYPVASK
jgi:mono/diheme cytochrome c family protein